MARLTVFHTSDTHNRLDTDIHVPLLTSLKKDCPGSILLDSGDSAASGNVTWRSSGERPHIIMTEAGYDAMCMGNREFHFFCPGLVGKLKNIAFPVLSANFRLRKTDCPVTVAESTIIERAGERIGIIGLSVPRVTKDMKMQAISAAYLDDPLETAKQIVPEMKSRCDYLIALTHIGIVLDREIAEKVPGIDLVLGGHTHIVVDETADGGTRIVHSGSHMKIVSRLDIDTKSKDVVVTRIEVGGQTA